MKKKATVVILVCSVIVFVLLCLLFTGLMIRGWGGEGNSFFGGVFHLKSYDETGYQAGNATFSAEELKTVKIDWVSGSVTLQTHDKPTIEVFETYEGSEDGRLRVRYENGELSVKFSKPKWFFGFGRFENKNCTVLVPETLASELELVAVDNVSAAVSVQGLSGKKCRISTVSGDVRASNLRFSEADFDGVSAKTLVENSLVDDLRSDTVSGDFTLEGEVKSGRFNTVSGDISVVSAVCPDKIRTDAVSGNVRLTIPAESAFHSSTDKVSGSFRSDFSGLWQGDSFLVGTGEGDFSFDTVSGDIEILSHS